MKKNIFLHVPVFVFSICVICFSCRQKDYVKVMHNPLLYSKTMHELNYVVIFDIFTPPVASRVFAYSNLAAYEVLSKDTASHLNTLEGKVKDLNNIPSPDKNAKIDFPFASLIAMMKVGDQLTFSQDRMKVLADSIKTLAQNSGMPDDMYNASIKYGQQVGDSIISWSKKDNYAQTRAARFSVTGLDGHWTPTPPGYFDAVEPKWMTIRTMAIDSPNEFKAPGPPVFSTDKTSASYAQAKQVYDSVNHLDTTEKWIANFWDCNSFKLHETGHLMFATKAMTPPGHWMEITGTVSRDKNADFYTTVKSYTLASIGMFDGFIVCWWYKYHYDNLRPETYINKYIDSSWHPELQTPPFPEYYSAHSVISSAASTVLSKIYGENTPFRDSSERSWGWADRSFTSFDQCAKEVAMSRFYGGIHYYPAVIEGYKQGKNIGAMILDRMK